MTVVRFLSMPRGVLQLALDDARLGGAAPEPYFDPVLTHLAPHLPRTDSITGSPRDGAIYS